MADLQEPNSSCPICLDLHKPAWTLQDFECEPPRDEPDNFGDYVDLQHEFSPKEVVGSAEKGCRGCRLIARIFPYDLSDPAIQTGCLTIERPHMNVKISIFHVLEKESYEDSSNEAEHWVDVRELLTMVGSGLKVGKISPTASDGPTSLCAYLRNASQISGDTGSDQAVSWAAFWLKECSTHHKKCFNIGTSYLPTRVLFLKGPKDASLVVSNGEVAPYACLSYCWGKRHPIKTTTSTLARYLEGLPWEDLPKTFQDAASFVYRLGIRYLWIDSLCILQDSIDDWLQEGSKMSHIYRDSLITLHATLGKDPYEGIFNTSYTCHVSQHLITTGVDESLVGIHYRVPLEHTPQQLSPLWERGWAFQERLLSPRVLLFGREELAWECRKGDVCECSGIMQDACYKRGRQSASYDCLRFSLSFEQLEYTWELLVEEYSAKSLTKPGDIFPALQGLAKVVSPVMGHYLAGHWNATLVHSLPWYKTFYAPVRINDQWCAPTWSWASSSGRVRWPNQGLRLRQSLCTVLSATTVPIGEDVTGQLDSGWLVLKGRCLPCNTRLEHNTDGPRRFSNGIDVHVGSVDTVRSVLRRRTFSLDRSDAKDRCDRGDGPDAKAFLVCEDDVAQYWLILITVATSSAYERLGLMIIGKSSPGEQETLRLFESAAEETEVTIF